MSNYSFSEEAISNAIEAARNTHEKSQLKANEKDFNVHDGGCLLVTAECISVTVKNHAVCIDLPLGFGSRCFSLPISIPDGTAAQACLSICTTWGIPTGVKISVNVAGVPIISKSFGKC